MNKYYKLEGNDVVYYVFTKKKLPYDVKSERIMIRKSYHKNEVFTIDIEYSLFGLHIKYNDYTQTQITQEQFNAELDNAIKYISNINSKANE